MKKIVLLVVMILSLYSVRAQEYILKNVEADRIDDGLYLVFSVNTKDTTLKYIKNAEMCNPIRNNPFKIEPNHVFAAGSSRVNVWAKFLNPLKFQIDVGHKVIEDTELSNGIASLFGALNAILEITGSVSISSTDIGDTLRFVSKGINNCDSLRTPEAILIYLWLKSDQMKGEVIDTLLDDFLQIMADADEAMTNGEFERSSKSAFQLLLEPDSIWKMDRALKEFVKDTAKLKKSYIEEKKLIDNLKNYEISKFIVKGKTKASNLVNTYRTTLIEKYNKTHALREKQLAAMSSIWKTANEFLGRDRQGEFYMISSSLEVERRNTTELTITVNEIKYNSEMKSESKKVLEEKVLLKRNNVFILNFSGTLVYTNVSYTQFGVESALGETFVTETKEEKDRFTAAPCMNVLLNIRNSPLLPGLQFGFGPGKDYPLLLGGLCFCFPDYDFSISLGGAFTWNRQLSDLKVGDPVSGTTEITEHTVWKFNNKPALYIGLNYNIGRKK